MTLAAHAVLSASSAARWIHCPPSALLAAQAEKTTSQYAEAGRVAHELAELRVLTRFGMIQAGETAKRYSQITSDQHWDPAMEDATQVYEETVFEEAMRYQERPFIATEARVDYSDIAPGGFGTSDCVLLDDSTITVIDYKNGSGVPVEAEENPQMLLYAYGAIRTYRAIFGDNIKDVRMVIVQPHAGGVKRWAITRETLDLWADTIVKPAAALAAEGKGDFCAGEWCDSHFCPVKGTCRARVNYMLDIGKRAPDLPPTITDDEVGEILTRAIGYDKWLQSLKDYAYAQIMSGKEISGWKLVAGRSARSWENGEDGAFPALMANGIPEAMLYERKPVTPPALEKAMGKKAFAEKCGDFVHVAQGKPTMVPASDKRPPYNPVNAAFKDEGDE